MELVDAPLTDAVDRLKSCCQIEIQFDKKAMEEASIALGTPVKKNPKGVPLELALKRMLGELGLTYVIQDDVLLITTNEAAERARRRVAYRR